VARAVIAHMVTERIPERAAEAGRYLTESIRRIGSPKVREVRGLGLMIGIELKAPAGPYVQRLVDEGVLVLLAGRTVIRLLPPLIIERADLDEVATRLARVLA